MKLSFNLLRQFLLVLSIALSSAAFGQTATMTTSGNWNVAGNWTSSNIGDLITETVTINSNVSPTIPSGLTYTVGNTTLSNNNNFTIDNTSTLNVGQSGTAKNFTTNLNPNLVINGVLEIWGNFVANNNVVFNITGTVHIHGNMQFSGSGTNVTVNGAGKLIVDGNMTGSGNVNFNVNGQVDVKGNVAVGSGSNLNGSGTFKVGGTCSGTPFCSSGILPVELLFFRTKNTTTQTEVVWATASEIDVDYFTLEKSLDGKVFNEIGKISAMGSAVNERIYTYIDEKPAAGISFYRLNEVSRNGSKKVLSTVRNKFDASKSVDIFPNPSVRDEPISFSLNFKSSEAHEISVFDVRGVLMGKAVMNGSEATIPLSLSSGVYIVRVASSEFSSVQRIVVQ